MGPAPDAGQGHVDAARPVRPSAPELPDADRALQLRFGESAEYRFTVSADLGKLDVHFSVDTTQSIADEIDQLQRTLRDDIVAGLRKRVADVAFGVSRFEDFPIHPFGSGDPDRTGSGAQRPDVPFELLTPITDSTSSLSRAINRLDAPLGFGGDAPESGAEALWQIATGEGYTHEGITFIEPFDADGRLADGEIGGVGFREGALHVVVHITDADTHRPGDYGSRLPGLHSLADAIDALRAIEARVIGVASDECASCTPRSRARGHLEQVAFATGAILRDVDGECPTGVDGAPGPRYQDTCPLVFGVNGEGDGLPDTVGEAVIALLDGIRFEEIAARASDDPIGFVSHIEADLSETEVEGDASPPEAVDRLPEEAPDGVPDTFVRVSNRTSLAFRVMLHNDAIAPAAQDQAFRVVVTARSGELVVAERTLRVIVPAGIPGRDEDGGR